MYHILLEFSVETDSLDRKSSLMSPSHFTTQYNDVYTDVRGKYQKDRSTFNSFMASLCTSIQVINEQFQYFNKQHVRSLIGKKHTSGGSRGPPPRNLSRFHAVLGKI